MDYIAEHTHITSSVEHWTWNVCSLEDPDWGLVLLCSLSEATLLNGPFFWNIIFVVETDCLSYGVEEHTYSKHTRALFQMKSLKPSYSRQKAFMIASPTLTTTKQLLWPYYCLLCLVRGSNPMTKWHWNRLYNEWLLSWLTSKSIEHLRMWPALARRAGTQWMPRSTRRDQVEHSGSSFLHVCSS